jgi:LemA protein
MLLVFWILIIVGILLFFILFGYYNRFVLLGNRIDNSLAQINVQLKRRADLIPNLIEAVKGFMKHEKAAIKAVTDARKVLMGAKGVEQKVEANRQLESALKTIFALAENYPDLKANTNFIELQRELTATEDKIAYARQFYNDSILTYNNLCKTFPGLLFANLYGKREREYLQITEAEKKKVDVKF